MKIKVVYLARLAEDMGKHEEFIEMLDPKSTINDVFLICKLDKVNYKIYSARNFEHSDFKTNIKNNDEIAFFPTITGG
jgi:molybdopterin converting factor small subunit|tara:strand:- start:202 stop:435 length:234 start_codon:yes stop_codon:yes gene_type:complete